MLLRHAASRAAIALRTLAPAGSLGTCGVLGAAQVQGAVPTCLLSTAEDALSSGKAPTSVPPDHPVSATDEFEKLADLYLGGLWERMEANLEGVEQEGRRFDAQMGHGELKVSLPDGGRIRITKDPGSCSLVVRTNMHDMYGSDGTDTEVLFKLQQDRTWETDGEELHEYLEDGLAKHLKVQVDLEPESQTQYGPDPT
ncbi:hypothetical protein ABPG75_002459 [Micractinium tetrahymenae]